MRSFVISFSTAVLLAITALPVVAGSAQMKRVSESHYPLPEAMVYEFHSEKAGRDLKIMVSLPGSYASSETSYPVIYGIDGQWSFSALNGVIGGLHYDRGAREHIIIGITWDGDVSEANRLRFQDLTPTTVADNPETGKADKFLDMIQYELIPYVHEHYRASEDSVLVGSSLGGLFTLYALFTRPALFSDYLASTPSVWWDDRVIGTYQAAFSEQSLKSPARLYIARGEVEFGASDIDVFVKQLEARDYQRLEIDFDIIRNAGHGALNPEAYTRGMQFIFGKTRIAIDQNTLTGYAGTYKSENGLPDIQLEMADGELFTRIPDSAVTVPWIAVAENLFYLANTGAEATFVFDDKQQVIQVNIKAEQGILSFQRQF